MSLLLTLMATLQVGADAPRPGIGRLDSEGVVGKESIVLDPKPGPERVDEPVLGGRQAPLLPGTVGRGEGLSCEEPLPDIGGGDPGIPGRGEGGGARFLDADALGWSVWVSALGREVNGHLRVREFDVSGSTLNFRKDLGVDFAEGGQLTLQYRSPGFEGIFEAEYLTASGRHTLGRDVYYNGTRYAAGIPIHTGWGFTTIRALVALRDVVKHPDSWEVDPVVGLEYPYYLTDVTSSVTPHNSEDWVHNYPYPVVGVVGRFALTRELSVGGRLTVGYVPNVPAAYLEGGRLYVSTRPSVALDVPLEWRVSERVLLSLDFQYRYWNGRDHSVEDGNVLRFSTPGVSLGVGYHW